MTSPDKVDRAPKRVGEPPLIGILRAQAEKPENSFGATVFCPAGAAADVWRTLGIRPQMLDERANGDRLYRITTRQAIKALKRLGLPA